MSSYNTVQTTYGHQNSIAHVCSVIIVRRLTGPLAFFLFARDHTLWLVSKVHLISIPTDNRQWWSVTGDGGGGGGGGVCCVINISKTFKSSM